MRIDVFLLSDAATVADGKLYVHGGGITRINALTLPASVRLALTLRLMMSAEELDVPHKYSCQVMAPDGSALTPAAVIDSSGGERVGEPVENEENYLQFTLEMGLVFPIAGVYTVVFDIDEERVREIPLPVIDVPAALGPVPPNRAERRRQERGRR